MRTLIRGGWVVGYSGSTHTLIRDGAVVYEDDTILHVGADYDGRVDREIDAASKLVSPGFIDTHIHSGHRAAHRLITDAGRPEYFGQPFFETLPSRRGRPHGGDAGDWVKRADEDEAAARRRIDAATYTIAELLRNGTTTFMDFGAQLPMQQALLAESERLGIRAYLAPSYASADWVGEEDGRLARAWDEEKGRRGLRAAIDFIGEHDGAADGRIRGILIPFTTELMSLELLRETRKAADSLGVPVSIHAAYNVVEFFQIVTEHGMTPIELLDSVGLCASDVLIGHGNFVAENPRMNYAAGRDLELMASGGATVSHCPINLARRGRCLDSWSSYRKAGVNVALGSDTFPRDMIMNMRCASLVGKIVSGSFLEATAAEMFEAATLNATRVLGRDDLGRLAPGAKADIAIVDISGRGTLRYGPVRDPIKSLVDVGVGDDVDTVIVDGITRVEGGRVHGVDMAAVRRFGQEDAERLWGGWRNWDVAERSAEEASPWSFPLSG